ncbi:HAMP domain-containing sensor histidine kinase [Microbacterium sp.]|uniref:sensor histidine kinase n=1 Tax=Microbacterium sp. TaxID=51671 RepID=UPI00334181AE
MSGRADRAVAADRRRVQRSALRTGLWVGLASAAVVSIITVVIVTVMVTASRPDRRPRPAGGPGGHDGRILDLDDVLPVAILLGLAGVLALAVIAWYASRRASEPLAEALGVQRAFVADASHELRTPLTTLNSRIQLAEHRLQQGGDVGAVLHDMRHDAEVMDAVLTDLLLAADSAGARSDDAGADTPVSEAVAAAVAVIGPRAESRGVRVETIASEDLRVAADPTALTRALIALLDNAVRYAADDGVVRVAAAPDGRRVALRVSDDGPGLGDLDPERVFERFARSTASSERRGFGLGLALVRDIATRFGGSVEVEETSARGTVFLLVLPRRH